MKERFSGWVLVGIAIAFNLVALRHELTVAQHPVNDMAFHLGASKRAGEALTSGENPLDAWYGAVAMGYPLWRVYQPVPHIATGVLIRLSPLEPPVTFAITHYLLLSFLPLGFYVLARAVGMNVFPAGVAAILSVAPSCIADYGRFGIGYSPYVWRGAGLYAQLWGLTVGLPALALGLRSIRTGRLLVPAGIGLGLAFLSHGFVGYIMSASLVMLAAVGYGTSPPPLIRRLFRAAVILGIAGIAVLWFIVPMVLDGPAVAPSAWNQGREWMTDSLGAGKILGALATGKLFDQGRFPVLTLLLAAGVVVAGIRFGCHTYRALLVLGIAWLALFFGRPTWGHLLDALPFGSRLHLHRFELGFEVFSILLAAAAVGALFEYLRAWHAKIRFAAAVAGLLLILAPVYAERTRFLAINERWGRENILWYNLERATFEPLISEIARGAGVLPGQVHAGRLGGWGKDFRIGYTRPFAVLVQHGIPSTSFLYYVGSTAGNAQYLMDEARADSMSLFGVRWALAYDTLPPPAGAQLTMVRSRFRLYEIPSTFFHVQAKPMFLTGENDFSASSQWLIKYKPDANPCGTVISESKSGERYSALVSASSPCYLTARMSAHPGLRFTVDGEPSTPRTVAPGFPAIPLSPGEHRVVVEYDAGALKPFLLVLGALIFCLGIALEHAGQVTAIEAKFVKEWSSL